MHTVSMNMLKLFVVTFPLLVNAAEKGQPNLAGVWKTVIVSYDDPNWRAVDVACLANCTVAQNNYLEALLRDPANDDRSLVELNEQSKEYYASFLADQLTREAKRQLAAYDAAVDDAALDCNPDGDGLHHQIFAPAPIRIEQSDDKIIIQYEYWNAVRTIHTDGRGHPLDVEESRLGHSIGWYEGPSLVVETVKMIPVQINLPPNGRLTVSRDATFTERYTLSDDGNRLDLEVIVVDPKYFREPYRGLVSLLLAPGWELNEWVCETITGEF